MKAFILPLLGLSTALSFAQYPNDFELKNLEAQYRANQQCADVCGSTLGLKITQLDLHTSAIQFEVPVSATQLTMVALPFNASTFTWNRFNLDGKVTNAVTTQNDTMYVVVPQGKHTLTIDAFIKNDQLRIALREDPKYFENATSTQVDLRQLGPNVVLDITNSLKDTKAIKKDVEISTTLFNQPLYKIERELFLADKWKLKTTVTPFLSSAANKVTAVNIPLLDGENPLTSELDINNKQVHLSLTNTTVTWESNLTPTDKVTFKNSNDLQVQTWKIYNSSHWVYDYQGNNPIEKTSNDSYTTINTWLMWPQEKVDFTFSLPTIAPGQTTNVASYKMETHWGTEPLQHTANFVINTSTGGRYTVKFKDPNTESISVNVGGQKVNTAIKKGELLLDLLAGQNNVQVAFKSGSASLITTVPELTFETPVTNAEFTMSPQNRWILLSGGGDIRPAVLLIGLLCFITGVAIALSKLKQTPLSTFAWVLLMLGLSQSTWLAMLTIGSWIFLFAWRTPLIKKMDAIPEEKPFYFNSLQVVLSILTLSSLLIIIESVASGLLSVPDSFITGIRSSNASLYWYIQSWDGLAKTPWVMSIPVYIYRGFVLVWGVWLAFNLLTWLKWMWTEYSTGGYWMKPIEKSNTSSEELDAYELHGDNAAIDPDHNDTSAR